MELASHLYDTIEREQRAFCAKQGVQHVASLPESRLGFAKSTKGKIPINGLRHPEKCETSGWYLWCGENYSEAADFFDALCAKHVYQDYPEIRKLLGLPAGYRFLLAENYCDVWYDAHLLNV